MNPRQPPLIQKTLAEQKRDRRLALKALDEMPQLQYELIRWRFILANMPPGAAGRIKARSQNEVAALASKLEDARRAILVGLGADPDEDGPMPKTHWDKTAMED